MSYANSNSFSITIAAPTAPAWFTAMADNTWYQVAGGTGFGVANQNGKRVQDVLPAVSPGGTSSRICAAWNGGCVDQTRNTFMLANSGGHTDYGGNEIYALNLSATVPGWVLVQNPTPIASQTPNLPAGSVVTFTAGITTGGAMTVQSITNGQPINIGQQVYQSGANSPFTTITGGSGSNWTVSPAPATAISNGTALSATSNNGNATWSDGNPASTHNWQRPCSNGSFICLPSLDALANTAWTTQCWLYNLNSAYAQQASWPLPNTSGLWISPGVGLGGALGGSPIGLGGNEGGMGVWDAINGLFWGATLAGTNGAGQGLWSVNPSTNSVLTYAGLGSGSQNISAMCPKLRSSSDAGCIISMDVGAGALHIVDVANPTAPTNNTNVTLSNFGNLDAGGHSGKVFQPVNRSILYWNENSTTFFDKITIPTNPLTGTYTYSQAAWTGSINPSAGQVNGTYGRFNVINNMGTPENKMAIVLLNDISQPTYVLKVPTAGL